MKIGYVLVGRLKMAPKNWISYVDGPLSGGIARQKGVGRWFLKCKLYLMDSKLNILNIYHKGLVFS